VGLTIGWEASSVRSEGSSSNKESASGSDARFRFLATDLDRVEAEFDFEKRERREGGGSEGSGEAERSRDFAGIEQRRDNFLSAKAGRFLIRLVERHCLCHAVWHESRGQKCIVNDSGNRWTASGLYGCLHIEQTSSDEKAWHGLSAGKYTGVDRQSKLTVTWLILGLKVCRKKKVVGPMKGGSRLQSSYWNTFTVSGTGGESGFSFVWGERRGDTDRRCSPRVYSFGNLRRGTTRMWRNSKDHWERTRIKKTR